MALTSTERSRLWRERHPGADAEKSRRYRNTPKGQLNENKKSAKRRMLKLARYSINYIPQHGTKNGYDWHRRGAFEDPCIPCREAMMAYWVYERTIKDRGRGHREVKDGAIQIPFSTQEVLDKYGSICHICSLEIDLNAPRRVGIEGWEEGLQIDHVVPISKYGDDILSNVRPSHGKCNIRKGAKLL